MTNKLDSVMQEARSYWYEDGFAEIAAEILFGAMSLVLVAQHLFSNQPMWLVALVMGLTVLIALGGMGVRSLVTTLKERVTYPRTGYVEYSDEPDPRAQKVALLIPILLGIGVVFIPNGFAAMWSAVGLALGVFMGLIAYQTGISRFTVASAIAIASGVLSSYLGFNDVLSTAMVFGVAGFSILVGGGLTLKAYLRDNPPLDGDE